MRTTHDGFGDTSKYKSPVTLSAMSAEHDHVRTLALRPFYDLRRRSPFCDLGS
jgi:hypothetical protein